MLLANVLFKSLPIRCQIAHLSEKLGLVLPGHVFGIERVITQFARVNSGLVRVWQAIWHDKIIA